MEPDGSTVAGHISGIIRFRPRYRLMKQHGQPHGHGLCQGQGTRLGQQHICRPHQLPNPVSIAIDMNAVMGAGRQLLGLLLQLLVSASDNHQLQRLLYDFHLLQGLSHTAQAKTSPHH